MGPGRRSPSVGIPEGTEVLDDLPADAYGSGLIPKHHPSYIPLPVNASNRSTATSTSVHRFAQSASVRGLRHVPSNDLLTIMETGEHRDEDKKMAGNTLQQQIQEPLAVGHYLPASEHLSEGKATTGSTSQQNLQETLADGHSLPANEMPSAIPQMDAVVHSGSDAFSNPRWLHGKTTKQGGKGKNGTTSQDSGLPLSRPNGGNDKVNPANKISKNRRRKDRLTQRVEELEDALSQAKEEADVYKQLYESLKHESNPKEVALRVEYGNVHHSKYRAHPDAPRSPSGTADNTASGSLPAPEAPVSSVRAPATLFDSLNIAKGDKLLPIDMEKHKGTHDPGLGDDESDLVSPTEKRAVTD